MATPTDVGLARGAALRQRRLALGKTLEEVAAATRIPLAHLEALEEGRLDALPEGPYADMYHREVTSYLGDPDGNLTSPRLLTVAGTASTPLGVVRSLAALSVVGLAALIGLALWPVVSDRMDTPDAAAMEQELVITVRHTTHLRVTVDGVEQVDGKVQVGQRLEYIGQERIEVEVPATEHIRLTWNGERVVPQGLQDAPRRLVFVDDVAGQP